MWLTACHNTNHACRNRACVLGHTTGVAVTAAQCALSAHARWPQGYDYSLYEARDQDRHRAAGTHNKVLVGLLLHQVRRGGRLGGHAFWAAFGG